MAFTSPPTDRLLLKATLTAAAVALYLLSYAWMSIDSKLGALGAVLSLVLLCCIVLWVMR